MSLRKSFALAALMALVACSEDKPPPGAGEQLAVLPGFVGSLVISGDRAVAAGYPELTEVDLSSGRTRALPTLDDARLKTWLGTTHLEFSNEEFLYVSGDKAYFPSEGVVETPVVYELDLSTGAIRDMVPPESELNRIGTSAFFAGEPDALYVETMTPNIVLRKIDPTTGDWAVLSPGFRHDNLASGPIFVDGRAIYFGAGLAMESADGAGMIRWDKATATFSTVAKFRSISRVTADDEYVYVIGESDYQRGEPPAWGLFRVPVMGGVPEVLFKMSPNSPITTGLVVDDRFLYFSEQLRVLRLDKRGGEVEVLAEHGLPGLYHSLRLAAGTLYWVDDASTQTIVRRIDVR